MRLLAIETSCDETAAAVVDDGCVVRSSVVSSQVEVHAPYGGVVPEIASRQHTERIAPVIVKAMADAQSDFDDLDAVGVTQGPGLVGCLLVGIQVAKGIAFTRGKPLVPVHHVAGHIEAPFLTHPEIPLPAVALVVSGGHTSLFEVPERGRYLLLGRTRDDAAGEAFDKVAKLLGLGYPGGPIIERLARGADDHAVEFRVAKISDGRPDFSFSGLKTAVLLHVRRSGIEPVGDPSAASPVIRDLVASFQRSVIEALVRRLVRVAQERRPRSLLLSGGVAANGALREAATIAAHALGLPIFIPPLALATDNAAMIAAAASINFQQGRRGGWDLNAQATLALDSQVS
jgi:N6-L-threonylcarbamoyladenine synthase